MQIKINKDDEISIVDFELKDIKIASSISLQERPPKLEISPYVLLQGTCKDLEGLEPVFYGSIDEIKYTGKIQTAKGFPNGNIYEIDLKIEGSLAELPITEV